MDAPTVCVTGASGFIASTVVKDLLEQGYKVKGTVRSLKQREKYEHVLNLAGEQEGPDGMGPLQVFEADLLSPGSFDKAMHGCEAVIHCASPFFFKTDNPNQDLIRPAVDGTLNVLRAAASAGVKRVVLTSSVAAIYVSRMPHDHVYSEADWSDLEYIRETKQHYAESKLLAERAAWEWMASPEGKACGFTLATCAPTQTLGPILQPYLNQSSAGLLDLMDGSKAEIPAKAKCFVDVRDVAQAHILAMQRVTGPSPVTLAAGAKPGAPGPLVDPATGQERYLLIAGSWPWRAVADVLRQAVPHAPVPTTVEAGPAPPPQALASIKRVWDLGVRYRPLEDTLRDAAMSLDHRGFLAAAVQGHKAKTTA